MWRGQLVWLHILQRRLGLSLSAEMYNLSPFPSLPFPPTPTPTTHDVTCIHPLPLLYTLLLTPHPSPLPLPLPTIPTPLTKPPLQITRNVSPLAPPSPQAGALAAPAIPLPPHRHLALPPLPAAAAALPPPPRPLRGRAVLIRVIRRVMPPPPYVSFLIPLPLMHSSLFHHPYLHPSTRSPNHLR